MLELYNGRHRETHFPYNSMTTRPQFLVVLSYVLVAEDARDFVVSVLRGNIAEFRFSCIPINPSFGFLACCTVYVPLLP